MANGHIPNLDPSNPGWLKLLPVGVAFFSALGAWFTSWRREKPPGLEPEPEPTARDVLELLIRHEEWAIQERTRLEKMVEEERESRREDHAELERRLDSISDQILQIALARGQAPGN